MYPTHGYTVITLTKATMGLSLMWLILDHGTTDGGGETSLVGSYYMMLAEIRAVMSTIANGGERAVILAINGKRVVGIYRPGDWGKERTAAAVYKLLRQADLLGGQDVIVEA
jgi:hypothetical protein